MKLPTFASFQPSLGSLFVWILCLKIVCVSVAVPFDSDTVFYTLGIGLPVFFFGYYVVQGYLIVRDQSPQQKIAFGDSCYYLGFLFTIASIIASLFFLGDLAHGGSVTGIASRFGAAMVTTLIGMGIRVWYVTFAKAHDDPEETSEQKTPSVISTPEVKNLKPREIPEKIKARSAEEKLDIAIDINTDNLRLFNRSLVESINDFDKLRIQMGTMVATTGNRVTNELEGMKDACHQIVEEMRQEYKNDLAVYQTQLQQIVKDAQEEMQKSTTAMTATVSSLKDDVADSLHKAQKDFLDITEKTAQVAVDHLNTSSQELVTTVKEARVPIQNLSQAFEDTVSSMTGSVSEYQKKLSDAPMPNDIFKTQIEDFLASARQNYAQDALEFRLNLAQSAQQAQTELQKSSAQTAQTLAELSAKIDKQVTSSTTEFHHFSDSVTQAAVGEIQKNMNALSQALNDYKTKLQQATPPNVLLASQVTEITSEAEKSINEMTQSLDGISRLAKNLTQEFCEITEKKFDISFERQPNKSDKSFFRRLFSRR